MMMSEVSNIGNDVSDIGAACEEYKHLIDKCRSEILTLVREESSHNQEVVSEYEETYTSSEVTLLSPLIDSLETIIQNYMTDEISNPDSIFTKHQRKRDLIDLLKKTINTVENINREYETLHLNNSGSRIKQCMTLDRSLVDIGSTDENDAKQIKTNHAELVVGAYFNSFSKCIDLNVEYETSGLYLSSIEELTEILSMKYEKTCECLNNLIDKKESLEKQLSDLQYSIANLKIDKPVQNIKKEQKIDEFSKIASKYIQNAETDSLSKLFELISDKPSDISKQDIDSLVDNMINSLTIQSPQLISKPKTNVQLTPQPQKKPKLQNVPKSPTLASRKIDLMISKIKNQLSNAK